MSLSDITREAVEAAIAEYDRLGQDEFLETYGFKQARSYRLIHNGNRYDSKAIVGAAHGFVSGHQALTASDFSGGEARVGRLLQHLGFIIQADDSTGAKPKSRLATPEEIAAIRTGPYDPALRKTKFGDINFRSCVLCGWQYAEPEGTNQRYCGSEWKCNEWVALRPELVKFGIVPEGAGRPNPEIVAQYKRELSARKAASDRPVDPLVKLADLRRNRIGGSVALHKPLLLLLALGRLEKSGSSELPWSVAEVELADLITRFTPPTRTSAAQRAAYPFTRLRADGVWVLDRDVAMDSVRELNAVKVTGRLEPAIEAALRDRPKLVHQAARMLVLESFSADAAPGVLTAVGLDSSVILGSSRPDIQHPGDSQRRGSRGEYQLADYVNPTISEARPQFRSLLARRPVESGRQVTFLPVETLLCLAASFVVNHRSIGGSTADRAPEPVSSLARLFSRRPSSILAKMANLDDSRPNGARWDAAAGAALRDQPTLFTHIYRVLIQAARAEGIDSDSLPDFLELEHGGEFQLLGQDELGPSEIGELRNQVENDGDESESETERIMLAAVRAGQHLFAVNVLRNCGNQCVFCGLRPSTFGGRRMLIAGHIKPWRDSTPRERLDLRNGLAACPAHDVAFDTGLIAIDDDMHIRLADSLAAATCTDPMAKNFYGQPPMLDTIQLPSWGDPPLPKYLDWHRQHVFVDRWT